MLCLSGKWIKNSVAASFYRTNLNHKAQVYLILSHLANTCNNSIAIVNVAVQKNIEGFCWVETECPKPLFIIPNVKAEQLNAIRNDNHSYFGCMSMHETLVCACCSSWIQFDTSGCTKSWAEMSRGACAFTCKGCRQAARLVGELRDLRQMMDSLKRMITGQGLEEESGETGDQVARREETEEKKKCEPVMTPRIILTEESRKGKETAERRSSEDRGTDIEMEGEHGTEEEETGRQLLDGKGLRPGTQMLATHSYKNNPNGPVGNELDLKEGYMSVYLMEHDDNESWWLAEDVNGEVGYVPAAYLMIILDEFLHEEESRKEAHEKRTDGTKIRGDMGLDGERRKT